jgi:DNA-binding NtrC family response regulator
VSSLRPPAEPSAPAPTGPALEDAADVRLLRTEDLVRPLVGRDLDEVERALILETLAKCAGNRTLAAQILGVSVRTIHNKLRRWRLAPLEADEAT